MTAGGLTELQIELDELINIKIPAAIVRLSTARAHGDLSENAEYHAAKEDLAMLEGRRDELQDIVNRAEVVDTQGEKVGLGSSVVVTIQGKDTQHSYRIVGEWEANPVEGRISEKSPLGQALIGCKPGETVAFEAPAGTIHYVIKEVA